MWAGAGVLECLQLRWSLRLYLSSLVVNGIDFKYLEEVPLQGFENVIVAASRKLRLQVPDDKSLLYETADSESNIKGSRKFKHTKHLR